MTKKNFIKLAKEVWQSDFETINDTVLSLTVIKGIYYVLYDCETGLCDITLENGDFASSKFGTVEQIKPKEALERVLLLQTLNKDQLITQLKRSKDSVDSLSIPEKLILKEEKYFNDHIGIIPAQQFIAVTKQNGFMSKKEFLDLTEKVWKTKFEANSISFKDLVVVTFCFYSAKYNIKNGLCDITTQDNGVCEAGIEPRKALEKILEMEIDAVLRLRIIKDK